MKRAVGSSRSIRASSRAVLAPVGGWNALDPIASMPERDAIALDNFWPTTSEVQLRKGYESFATLPADTPPGTPHDIRTLLSYTSPTAKKLFAADQTGLYDITAGGAIAAISSAAVNGEWQYVNQTTAGGSFLWCCNGTDKSRLYDGAAWAVLDGASVPALTGVTSADVINVSLFKTRLILTVKNSLSFFFLPVVSIAGAASEFPLGSLFRLGGYLMATASWTLDAGEGADDYFVAITSEGEVAVYAGTDPSNAATWSLQGIYYIGKPLGRRCFLKVGGDLYILTVGGIQPLSKALSSADTTKSTAVTRKIEKAYTDYVQRGLGFFGWQAVLFPEASMMLFNVPLQYDAAANVIYSYQFVMNTITKSWARFYNQNAECWGYYDGELYFARHNMVFKAWTGNEDNGANIEGKVKTAFNYLGSRATIKHPKMVQPIFNSNSQASVRLGLDADFSTSSTTSGQSGSVEAVAQWDVAQWNEAKWTGSLAVDQWRTVACSAGRCFALRLQIAGKGITMGWSVTNFVYENGGLM